MSLAVVIPVFNEAKTIAVLIDDLRMLFASQNISCHFIIINDGSTDESLSILKNVAAVNANIEIISQDNMGHGPSLIKGYQRSLNYDWVFQLDSDYQYDLAAFITLWDNRHEHQLLVAQRKQRNASSGRDVVTVISQQLIRLLYGRGLKDINSPYRLIQTSKLAKALHHIKPNSFAPNILIAAWFIKERMSVFTMPVELKPNAIERKSKMSWYIFKGCVKSVTDIFLFTYKI